MTNYLDNIKTWDDYREFIQEKAKKISSDLMTAINILSR